MSDKTGKNIKSIKETTGARGRVDPVAEAGEAGENVISLAKERLAAVWGGYGELAKASKQTLAAIAEASTAAVQGIEALNGEFLSFGKSQFDETVGAVKAALNVKSPHELTDIQSNYIRGALEAYCAQSNKIGDMTASIVREAIGPITAQLQSVWGNLVKPLNIGVFLPRP